MKYFDEFSGFINDEKARAEEETRLCALNARLQYRLRNYTYEDTLQGLYGVLSANEWKVESVETVRTFA